MNKKKPIGRGRKPTDDPKDIIRLYVQKSVIKKLGGIDAVREVAYFHINEKAYPIK